MRNFKACLYSSYLFYIDKAITERNKSDIVKQETVTADPCEGTAVVGGSTYIA